MTGYRNRGDGRSKKGTACNRGAAHQGHCKSCIECVAGGGRVHSVYRKGRDTLFPLISFGEEATARSQLQQDVLGTTIKEMRCSGIVALVAIFNVDS